MRDIPLYGTQVIIAVITLHDSDGAAVDPDTTLTVADVSLRNTEDGNVVGANDMGVNVSNPETGIIVIKAAYEDIISSASDAYGMSLWGWLSASIGGVAIKVAIPPFRFIQAPNLGRVVADAGNTATTFKVLKSVSNQASLLAADDDPVNTLLVPIAGSNIWGQIQKVTAYDFATGFITVESAFTATPNDDSLFMLINC
jgi:hypothetical protein